MNTAVAPTNLVGATACVGFEVRNCVAEGSGAPRSRLFAFVEGQVADIHGVPKRRSIAVVVRVEVAVVDGDLVFPVLMAIAFAAGGQSRLRPVSVRMDRDGRDSKSS